MSLTILLAYLITCSWGMRGHAWSFFSRNVDLDNTRVTDASSNVLTSVPLDQCARHCHNTLSCLSLAYNRNDERCELFSRVHIAPEDTSAAQGNSVFWKRADQGTCGVPTTIPKGRVLYIDGQVEGSKAEFVCDDFHIPTTETGVCDSSRTWAGLDNPCQSAPSSPYTVPAAGKIHSGVCVIAMATPIVNTGFRFVLEKQETDYSFVLNPRFDYGGDYEILVRNAKMSGVYGPEERDTPTWPFTVNQEFNLTVCAEETLYRVLVDETEVFTFDYRSPISGITKVLVDGAIVLRNVRFLG